MTANQIAYWNLQESKRTNRANEEIKGEQNAIQKQRVANEKEHWNAQEVLGAIKVGSDFGTTAIRTGLGLF